MLNPFRNVIVCEDIREEIGNKKSLMGVFGGDIIVGEFPANIRFAVYVEYIPRIKEARDTVTLTLKQDDERMVEISLKPQEEGKLMTLIVPQGIGIFSAPTDLILHAEVGSFSGEILRKKVLLGQVARH